MFKPCVLIPVYNHEHAIGAVVDAVLTHDIDCILVDDGSSPGCAAVLDRLVSAQPQRLILLRHALNQGKGGAVMTGMAHAAEAGFSHALQIDADGQHCVADISRFLEQAAARPAALIVGCPVYGDSVPLLRFYSRYLTHIWVWINTLSFKIKDSMCGFRVYPVVPTVALARRHELGRRMSFDIEVLVRLCWDGIEIVNLPTQVGYPNDGVSHFQGWLDNVLISRAHAVLFFGMLWRLPKLLAMKWRRVWKK